MPISNPTQTTYSHDDLLLLQEVQSTEPVKLTVNKAANELIQAKLRSVVECTYDEAARLVGLDAGLAEEDVLRLAGARDAVAVEDAIMDCVSKLQNALSALPYKKYQVVSHREMMA